MLRCNDICFAYPKKEIFNTLNFTLPTAQHLLISGDSGAGKSTLLALLTGLISPAKGSIIYDDTNITLCNDALRDTFRGQNIGIIFQKLHLIHALTTLENIALALRITGKTHLTERIPSTLDRLNILPLAHIPVYTLSVGEKQRVAIARAIITQPKWIYCDEPTSSLDDSNAEAILSLLESEAHLHQASLITITHDARVKHRFHHHQQLLLGAIS